MISKIRRKKKKKLDFANHVFRIILLIALSIFVGVSLFIFNSKTLLHNDYPTLGGYGVSVVISGSMEPTLNVNDLIIFHEQDEYEINDIIIYADKKSSVVHRLIEFKDDEKCITQGDANNTPDKEIFINQIKGKVICNIPFVGFFINDVSKYVFLFVIIGLLSLSFIAEAKNRKIDKMRTNLLLEEIIALRQNANTNNQVFQTNPENYQNKYQSNNQNNCESNYQNIFPIQNTIAPVQNFNLPLNQNKESQYEEAEFENINNKFGDYLYHDMNMSLPQVNIYDNYQKNYPDNYQDNNRGNYQENQSGNDLNQVRDSLLNKINSFSNRN